MLKREVKGLEKAKNALEELISNTAYATPFHTYEWLSSLQKNLGMECRIVEFYDGPDLVGICPFFPRKIGPVMKVNFSPVFGTETAYMGVLGKEPVDELLKAMKALGKFFIILPPGTKASSFEIQEADTIITKLDQENAEEHMKIVKKGHRYCARKAGKEGVKVRESVKKEDMEAYYDLLQSTYMNSDYEPLPLGFYEDIIEELGEKGNAKLLLAEYNGKLIGAGAFLFMREKMYYWTGGSLKEKEYSKLYPNDIIQKRILEMGYEQGIKEYDMLGASIEGIRRFKLGWGGSIAKYQRVYSSKSLKLMADTYNKVGSHVKTVVRQGIR